MSGLDTKASLLSVDTMLPSSAFGLIQQTSLLMWQQTGWGGGGGSEDGFECARGCRLPGPCCGF